MRRAPKAAHPVSPHGGKYDIDLSFVVYSVAQKGIPSSLVVLADARPQGRHWEILAYAEILVFFAVTHIHIAPN